MFLNCLSGKVNEISSNIKDSIPTISISDILNNFKEKTLSFIPIDSFREFVSNIIDDAKDIWNSIDVKGTLTRPKVVEVLNWCMIFILSYIAWRIFRSMYRFIKYIAKILGPFKTVLQELIEHGLNRILEILKKWLAILKKLKKHENKDNTSHNESRKQVQPDEVIEGLVFKDSEHAESLRRFEEKQEKEERYYNYYRCYGCNEKWETVTIGKGPVEMCRKANCNYLFGPYHEILLLNNEQMKEKYDSTRQS